jgi:type IV pilus assembly protein PilV
MSRGFTLIEALVALAVLSVGLLGAAAMLLGALRGQSQALRQAAAVALVADLVSRIRANPAARSAYVTDALLDVDDAGFACDDAAPCDPAALAAQDIAAAGSAARAWLPTDAHLSITFEPAIGPAAPDRYVVSLRWNDPRDPESADQVTLTLLARPVAGTA